MNAGSNSNHAVEVRVNNVANNGPTVWNIYLKIKNKSTTHMAASVQL